MPRSAIEEGTANSARLNTEIKNLEAGLQVEIVWRRKVASLRAGGRGNFLLCAGACEAEIAKNQEALDKATALRRKELAEHPREKRRRGTWFVFANRVAWKGVRARQRGKAPGRLARFETVRIRFQSILKAFFEVQRRGEGFAPVTDAGRGGGFRPSLIPWESRALSPACSAQDG